MHEYLVEYGNYSDYQFDSNIVSQVTIFELPISVITIFELSVSVITNNE